jgi:hypothetical protein
MIDENMEENYKINLRVWRASYMKGKEKYWGQGRV